MHQGTCDSVGADTGEAADGRGHRVNRGRAQHKIEHLAVFTCPGVDVCVLRSLACAFCPYSRASCFKRRATVATCLKFSLVEAMCHDPQLRDRRTLSPDQISVVVVPLEGGISKECGARKGASPRLQRGPERCDHTFALARIFQIIAANQRESTQDVFFFCGTCQPLTAQNAREHNITPIIQRVLFLQCLTRRTKKTRVTCRSFIN